MNRKSKIGIHSVCNMFLLVYSVGCVQCGACTVWGVYSVGCVQCGACTVWGVYSVGHVQCGACKVWGVYSVGHAQCGVCTVRGVYSVGRVQCGACTVSLENIVTLLHLLRLKSNLNLIGWNFKSNLSSNFHL